jgi:hypothetical protein
VIFDILDEGDEGYEGYEGCVAKLKVSRKGYGHTLMSNQLCLFLAYRGYVEHDGKADLGD